jgi:hypothetical protein
MTAAFIQDETHATSCPIHWKIQHIIDYPNLHAHMMTNCTVAEEIDGRRAR